MSSIICTVHNPGMDTPKRPRGRPRNPDPATARIELRCTPAEKAEYLARAEQDRAPGLSAWLKGLADEAVADKG